MTRKLSGYIAVHFAVERMVALLNDGECEHEQLDDSAREELRLLTEEWLASEANWNRFKSRMLKREAKKRKASRDYKGKSFPYNGTFYLQAAETGEPILITFPAEGASHAQGIFLQFILHPDHRQLAGPCRRSECGRYFLNRTSHRKLYCSQRCASHRSALEAMKRKRQELREQEVAKAQSAIARWERSHRQYEWKIWVETQTGFSTRRLDKWVATGELVAPAKRRQFNAKG